MIFRQLFEPQTSTYTYLVADEETKQALLIDPVVEEFESYTSLLNALQLKLVYTAETHVHADHVTGASLLREKLGSKSAVFAEAGAYGADLLLRDGDVLQLGSTSLEVRHTPGHTAGCISFVGNDRVFTGDALLIGGCGRTDFQEGSAAVLYQSIHQRLFTLPPDTLVYPGHDYNGNTVSTIKQEMAKNPRLGVSKTKQEFIELMGNLKLPYPRFIDRALPANKACGREASPLRG
jgi:sulfur dioxygenase